MILGEALSGDMAASNTPGNWGNKYSSPKGMWAVHYRAQYPDGPIILVPLDSKLQRSLVTISSKVQGYKWLTGPSKQAEPESAGELIGG